MQFNMNNQPSANKRDAWWENKEKISLDVQLLEREVKVLEACSYFKEYNYKDTPATHEVLELSLEIIKNGKETGTFVTAKIKGGKVINGQANTTAKVWDVLTIAQMSSPQEDILGDASSYTGYNGEERQLYPHLAGKRFNAQISTTGNFNGYNTYTVNLFSTSNRSGRELFDNIDHGDYAAGLASIREMRIKFAGSWNDKSAPVSVELDAEAPEQKMTKPKSGFKTGFKESEAVRTIKNSRLGQTFGLASGASEVEVPEDVDNTDLPF